MAWRTSVGKQRERVRVMEREKEKERDRVIFHARHGNVMAKLGQTLAFGRLLFT